MKNIIIHVDMDAFYASVEMRDDPSLRGRPLIIGALPSERGVVATASYEARKYGVHSGMNIKEAYRLCPRGIYRHPDFEKYSGVSHQLHEIWNTYASASEYIALDEAYLDVTEQAVDIKGARRIAGEIKRRTREELHLSCSVGVGYSKTAAKTASEEKKPDGYFEITTPEAFVDLIIDRKVGVLYTVGSRTAERLGRIGINTVRDVRERQEEVTRLLGKHGRWITQLAYGIDDRKVTPYRAEDAKSVSREITFQEDVDNYQLLDDVLVLLALCVVHRVGRTGLHGKGVTLKITYADMKNITRSRLVTSADSPAVIYRESLDMLRQIEHRPVRLIGAGVYNLSSDIGRQMVMDDYLEETSSERDRIIEDRLSQLGEHYGLDFASNLDKIYKSNTLHRTVEYMRRHF